SESTYYEGVEDQLTIELFYHWQKLKTLILTPDVQFIINPAQNPTRNFITVFGLRGRIFI
ncbi:carbohydrate porin, partial [Eudoraea sp.]|uniref:carbohydrate porin n=1 Tax=Eudoraea sp. TaxID=1979955 RepID=UPI003C75A4D0